MDYFYGDHCPVCEHGRLSFDTVEDRLVCDICGFMPEDEHE